MPPLPSAQPGAASPAASSRSSPSPSSALAPLRVSPAPAKPSPAKPPNTLNLRQSPSKNTAELVQPRGQQSKLVGPERLPVKQESVPNDASNVEKSRADLLTQERQQRVKTTVSQAFQGLYQQAYLDTARRIVSNSNQELEQITNLFEQQQRLIDDLKPPSDSLRSAMLLYTAIVDLAEIILAARAFLYGAATGVGAAAAGVGAVLGPALASLIEPILFLLDIVLDIPIFGYIWVTNRRNKKYIEVHDSVERAIAVANNRLNRRQAFIDQKAEAIGERMRQAAQQDSKKSRYSVSLIDRFRESRDRIRNLKEQRKQSAERYKKKLEFANKLIGKFKSGPIKKYGKTALRIIGDLVVVIDLYPFRVQTTRAIFKDHKGYYDQAAIDDRNVLREELNRFIQDISVQTNLAINTEETQDKLDAADAAAGIEQLPIFQSPVLESESFDDQGLIDENSTQDYFQDEAMGTGSAPSGRNQQRQEEQFFDRDSLSELNDKQNRTREDNIKLTRAREIMQRGSIDGRENDPVLRAAYNRAQRGQKVYDGTYENRNGFKFSNVSNI